MTRMESNEKNIIIPNTTRFVLIITVTQAMAINATDKTRRMCYLDAHGCVCGWQRLSM